MQTDSPAGLYPDAATAALRRLCEDQAAVMFKIASGEACRAWLASDACSLRAWRDAWDALVAMIEVAYDVTSTSALRVAQLVAANWDLVAPNVDKMLDEEHDRAEAWAYMAELEQRLAAVRRAMPVVVPSDEERARYLASIGHPAYAKPVLEVGEEKIVEVLGQNWVMRRTQ